MYRVDGSSDLKEESLEHWEGYRGSRPVRIGNGAADQLQLDIYGEALDSIYFADQRGLPIGHRGWTAIRELLDWLADNWDQPEEGIWETRGGRKDFTYGRVMCWVAFDRGIRLATAHGRPAAARRAGPRSATRSTSRSWTRAGTPDAAGLRPALRQRRPGLVAAADAHASASSPPHDPMWLSTLRGDGRASWSPTAWSTATTRTRRPTGCAGSEGTFSLCTFIYVDALARAGRLDDARLAFEKMLTYANHVGPVLRGDRPDRRADRQLPAGVHPPRAHRRRDHPRRGSRPGRSGVMGGGGGSQPAAAARPA